MWLMPNVARTISYNITRPLWFVGRSLITPISITKNFFVFKYSLITENLVLKDEVAALTLKTIDYDILLKENEDLKNEFGRVNKRDRILSWILSKPPVSPYDTLVIDVGSNEGVTLGSKAYISDSIIVGVVTSVTSHTSLVKLFSSGGDRQEATVSRTGATFEIIGEGGANFKLEVPKDTDILWGDNFLYPDSSSSVIGSVYYIDETSQSSFKTIYLRIPGNVFSSKHVFIEKRE